jgi:hypothetical protein
VAREELLSLVLEQIQGRESLPEAGSTPPTCDWAPRQPHEAQIEAPRRAKAPKKGKLP